MKIGHTNISGYAALAPMAGVADRAMREVCREFGAAYCVGELASAKGICLSDRKSFELLSATDNERPFAPQLFGCEPETMASAAKKAMRWDPDFIDINMGCPAPKVAGNGGGSALLKDSILAGEIVKSVCLAVPIPVTVKIRIGWDNEHIVASKIAEVCEQNGAAAITVHGRTKSQMYAPPVDIATIARVKSSVSIPVIANGDIRCGTDAARMFEQTNCDFIMIGRGAMGNPWVFNEINAYLKDGKILSPPTISERMYIMLHHMSKMIEYKGEKIGCLEARKHTAWYLKGIRGAAELRVKCGEIKKFEDIIQISKQVLSVESYL